MKNQLNPIDVTQLHPMLYRDLPVCTTEMLAQLYCCETRSLRDNFRNNADRFEMGKHYIQLQGAELREFVECDENIVSQFVPSKRAQVVNLWTERGAARHAKMLNTDQAWEVFEKLEDCYFHAKAQAVAPQAPALPEVLRLSDLDAMLDKPMQITVREYLALTQGRLAEPLQINSGRAYKQFLTVGEREEVIRLAEVDKMTPIEISELTHTLEDTVRTILYRRRKAKERDAHAKRISAN